MPLVLDVLHVTGSAVRFVGANQLLFCSGFYAAVVTGAAGLPRRFAVDRIEGLVAT